MGKKSFFFKNEAKVIILHLSSVTVFWQDTPFDIQKLVVFKKLVVLEKVSPSTVIVGYSFVMFQGMYINIYLHEHLVSQIPNPSKQSVILV